MSAAREWVCCKRWEHACRLLDLALLLGGEFIHIYALYIFMHIYSP